MRNRQCKENAVTHIVKQMLMSKSQLHPVINAAAAGGKIMATYSTLASASTQRSSITDEDKDNVRRFDHDNLTAVLNSEQTRSEGSRCRDKPPSTVSYGHSRGSDRGPFLILLLSAASSLRLQSHPHFDLRWCVLQAESFFLSLML